MKLSIALAALLTTGFVATSTKEASAVVYCTYVLRPRPVARAAVRTGTPMNRGGPVNRVGRF